MTDLVTIGFKSETAGLEKAQSELENTAAAGAKVDKAVAKTQGSLGGLGRSAGRAGVQIEQLVNQVAGGQSPMLALSQQATDLGIVLGAPLIGSIVGLSAALLGAMAPALLESESATENLEDALDRLDESTDRTEAGIVDFSTEIRRLAQISEVAALAKLTEQSFVAEDAMKSAAVAIKDSLSEIESGINGFDVSDAVQVIATWPVELTESSESIAAVARSVGEQMGLVGDEAETAGRKILGLAAEIQNTPSPEKFRELQDLMSTFAVNAGEGEEAFKRFVGGLSGTFAAAAEAGERLNKIQQARNELAGGEQLSASQAETKKLADATDRLTQSLETQIFALENGELAGALYAAALTTGADSAEQLDPKIRNLIETLHAKKEAQKEAVEAEKEAKKASEELRREAEAREKSTQALIDQLDPAGAMLRRYNEQVLMLVDAHTKTQDPQLLEFIAILSAEYEKAAIASEGLTNQQQALIDRLDPAAALARKFSEELGVLNGLFEKTGDPKYQEAIKALTEEYRKAVETLSMGKVDDSLSSLVDDVDSLSDSFGNLGNVIVGSFGDAADKINQFANRMQQLDKLRAKAIKEQAKWTRGTVEHQVATEQLAKINDEMYSAQLGAIGGVLGAAKNMFAEQSKEREALHRLEMAFLAAEMAIAAEKAIVNAVTAVANQGQGDPYTAFGRIAAMVAIMAGVLGAAGIAFGGGGGGGYTPPESGTGTVMGDSSAKSESISRSAEMFADIQIDQLAELRGIRSALTSLSSGIERLAISLVTGLDFSETGYAGQLGTISTGTAGSIGAGLTGFFEDFSVSGVGDPILEEIFSSFSRTSRDLLDSGIEFGAQTLGEVFAGGLDALMFSVIETTKKRLWGLRSRTTTSTEYAAIDQAITDQMADIFGFIGTAAAEAASSLGMGTFDELMQVLEGFQISIGQISFKDKTGEEIQEELEAMFSQQADLIAEYLMPAITQFQQMGEGAFETLQRVAMEQAIFNDALENMGMNLSDLSSIMQIEIGQSIIDMIGGIDAFKEATSEYFNAFFSEQEKTQRLQQSLADVFADLGVAMPTTMQGFRDLVESLDLTTESGQEMFAVLMQISPAFAQLFEAMEQVDADLLSGALDDLNRAIDAERQLANARLESARAAHAAEMDRLRTLRSSVVEQGSELRQAMTGAESALKSALNAQKQAIQQMAQERIAQLKEELSFVQSSAASLRSLSDSLRAQAGISINTDVRRALESARRGNFSLAQTLEVPEIQARDFAAASELRFAKAVQRAQVAEIAGLADQQASEFEQQMTAIERQIRVTEQSAATQIAMIEQQVNAVLGVNSEVLSLSEAIQQYQAAKAEFDAFGLDEQLAAIDEQIRIADEQLVAEVALHAIEMARLDSILESAMEQIDALNGISQNVMSVTDAVNALTALVAARTAPTAAPEPMTPPSVQTPVATTQDNEYVVNLLENIARNTSSTAGTLQRTRTEGQFVRVIQP